jgi:hypothetical protein
MTLDDPENSTDQKLTKRPISLQFFHQPAAPSIDSWSLAVNCWCLVGFLDYIYTMLCNK